MKSHLADKVPSCVKKLALSILKLSILTFNFHGVIPMFPRSYAPRVQRVRVRVRVSIRVRVRVDPKPHPNHNQLEDSHSNQSQANQRRKRRYLPLPSYEKKGPMFPGHIQSGEHRTRGT